MELFLVCWKRVFVMISVFSWQNSVSLCTPRPNLPVYSRCFLNSYFCIPVPVMKRTFFFFFSVSSRRSCRSSSNHSISASLAFFIGAQTWITLILNGLPWKQTEITLSFLRLHPSTAFWNLSLTFKATPFLLNDSCPQ